MRGTVILATTDSIPRMEVEEILGVVTAEWVGGVNVFRDIFAGIRNIVGGRSAALEKEMRAGRDAVIEELRSRAAGMGADAVLAVRFDSSPMAASSGAMLMLGAVGTAVRLRRA